MKIISVITMSVLIVLSVSAHAEYRVGKFVASRCSVNEGQRGQVTTAVVAVTQICEGSIQGYAPRLGRVFLLSLNDKTNRVYSIRSRSDDGIELLQYVGRIHNRSFEFSMRTMVETFSARVARDDNGLVTGFIGKTNGNLKIRALEFHSVRTTM